MKNIAIIGSNAVGRATGEGLLKKGHRVTFVDRDPYALQPLEKKGRQVVLLNNLDVRGQDVFFFCSSTPTVDEKIELYFLKIYLAEVGKLLRAKRDYFLVVIRSTVLPGTTENVVIPMLEESSGLKAGTDFGVCVNPEFIRDHPTKEEFKDPWMTVIGSLDDHCGNMLEELLETISVIHLSLKEAEAMKYVHEIFHATAISYFNEMKAVLSKIGLNPVAVFDAARRIAEITGNRFELPLKNKGPFRGTDMPKDTQAFLTWTRDVLGLEMHQLGATIEVNDNLKKRPAAVGFRRRSRRIKETEVPHLKLVVSR